MTRRERRQILILALCAVVFAVSLSLIFTQEKDKLDREFGSMITGSLNLHIQHNAEEIGQTIIDVGRAMQVAEKTLHMVDQTPQDFFRQRNAENPVYVVEYLTKAQMEDGGLSALIEDERGKAVWKLANGRELMCRIHYDEASSAYYLSVIMPLKEGGIPGALYSSVSIEGLLRETSESAVYQDVQSCFVTDDGTLIFNTFRPEEKGDLFKELENYGVPLEEIGRVRTIIESPEVDSIILAVKGETYFISAARLEQSGWILVSFARGPEALAHSENIFTSVVYTSALSILLTTAIGSMGLFLFLSGRKLLQKEQEYGAALSQRLKAMFEQHSALKVVFDAESYKIVDANPSLLEYFGYTREAVLGRKIHEFTVLSPEIHDERLRKELNREAVFSASPYRLKNGEIRYMDVHASVVQDGDNRLIYAILFDVTDREKFREDLVQEKERLRITLQSIGDGVVTTDSSGVITSLNSVAEKLTGWGSDQAVGRPFADVFILKNEESGEPVENPIQRVLETGLIIGMANHTELVNRQGKCISIADSAAPIKTADGQTFGVVMVFRDVGDEKEHNRQIEFLSYHDCLTGLYNRRYIEEAMNCLDRAEHLPISVVMADVNGLKITNDVFGHKAGDALLLSAAGLMRRCCGKDAIIARWGGDEFVILMPRTSLQTAEEMTMEIKHTPIVIENGSLSLSLSLGCACKDRLEGSIHAALQQAEEYMYHQKLLEGKSYRSALISTLLITLYEKSNETEEHSKRIEKYCHAIGRRLQLSSKEMDELSLFSLLHDIGKVNIDPNILKKPGTLTPEEWEEMKRHPEIGYRIAQATPELATVADLILSHHERWDGKGYPRGLKERAIPLACRILSVVDAFDAMTNDRIYRQAMTAGEAVLELESGAGTQFDPKMAELLIEIIINEEK